MFGLSGKIQVGTHQVASESILLWLWGSISLLVAALIDILVLSIYYDIDGCTSLGDSLLCFHWK